VAFSPQAGLQIPQALVMTDSLAAKRSAGWKNSSKAFRFGADAKAAPAAPESRNNSLLDIDMAFSLYLAL
jgi:hypothetical protein